VTTTVSNALAQQDTGPGALIKKYEGDFATVLPTHVRPETFVRLSQGLLRRNDPLRKVAERNPRSFMAALLDCARLGLEPGDTYHLVPFGDEVVGIPDYTGEIELIYRAGAVSSVKAEIVYERDTFIYRPDMERPEHEVDWFSDRGAMKGVYAYAIMKDGATSRVVVLNEQQINKIKAVSKTATRKDSPWQQWPDRMWLKTAVHQLQKWVPTSAEYITAQLAAVAKAQNAVAPSGEPLPPPNVDVETGEIHDAEIVEGQAPLDQS
jgi:recombination protein RecT